VDLGHPDLASKLTPGYDFVKDDDLAQDDYGHGTHVAGIAAAATNNAEGVAGVAWGARIMPIKVLDSSGNGVYSSVAAGIVWAADHGARIINLSLGGTNSSQTLRDAVDYAVGRGALLVAAAGNGYRAGSPVNYPAAYEHVLGVAATDDQDGHADGEGAVNIFEITGGLAEHNAAPPEVNDRRHGDDDGAGVAENITEQITEMAEPGGA
jgi:thermitase